MRLMNIYSFKYGINVKTITIKTKTQLKSITMFTI